MNDIDAIKERLLKQDAEFIKTTAPPQKSWHLLGKCHCGGAAEAFTCLKFDQWAQDGDKARCKDCDATGIVKVSDAGAYFGNARVAWDHHEPKLETYQLLAELLLKIGWVSRNDAQHENLRDALSKIRQILEPAF